MDAVREKVDQTEKERKHRVRECEKERAKDGKRRKSDQRAKGDEETRIPKVPGRRGEKKGRK